MLAALDLNRLKIMLTWADWAISFCGVKTGHTQER